MSVIRSRDNARVKAWMRLADAPRERRNQGMALIEGVHLLETYLQRGGIPIGLIASEAAMEDREIGPLISRAGLAPVVLAENLFKLISDAQTPSGVAAEIEIPKQAVDVSLSEHCVFLDGIQDAGNVGTLLRSAAAFGIADVVVGPGCADPWSPKALRAGMGGHFFLRIAATANLAAEVRKFDGKAICTAAHGGDALHAIELAGRVGWVFGSEAHGVSRVVAEATGVKVTIPTPGGAESLNVAASAAICFYERQRQLSTRINTRAARS